VAEFQAMVAALHAAGLEVLLDVVFNHTAEGDHLGPTLCHRGLDNPAYYRLEPADPGRYVDTTGCGNALNAGDPVCLRLIMDSLRYWLTEMGVDGFRFDLAPTLARQDGGFDRLSAFFDLVAQDPVVSRAKLIAEPWDVGQPDSYDVGRFPPGWSEWNGRYRDTMRDFWRRQGGLVGEFATRFSGSSDLYGGSRRRPTASVNLTVCTTASPSATWSPMTASTTRPTARPTGTAPTTTGPGTAGWKAPPATPRWWSSGPGSPGAC
jgi:isoamylase